MSVRSRNVKQIYSIVGNSIITERKYIIRYCFTFSLSLILSSVLYFRKTIIEFLKMWLVTLVISLATNYIHIMFIAYFEMDIFYTNGTPISGCSNFFISQNAQSKTLLTLAINCLRATFFTIHDYLKDAK